MERTRRQSEIVIKLFQMFCGATKNLPPERGARPSVTTDDRRSVATNKQERADVQPRIFGKEQFRMNKIAFSIGLMAARNSLRRPLRTESSSATSILQPRCRRASMSGTGLSQPRTATTSMRIRETPAAEFCGDARGARSGRRNRGAVPARSAKYRHRSRPAGRAWAGVELFHGKFRPPVRGDRVPEAALRALSLRPERIPKPAGGAH